MLKKTKYIILRPQPMKCAVEKKKMGSLLAMTALLQICQINTNIAQLIACILHKYTLY